MAKASNEGSTAPQANPNKEERVTPLTISSSLFSIPVKTHFADLAAHPIVSCVSFAAYLDDQMHKHLLALRGIILSLQITWCEIKQSSPNFVTDSVQEKFLACTSHSGKKKFSAMKRQQKVLVQP